MPSIAALPSNSFVFDFSILTTPRCCCLTRVRDQKHFAAMQRLKSCWRLPWTVYVPRLSVPESLHFLLKKNILAKEGCSYFEFMPGEDSSVITEWCTGWNHVFPQDPKTCSCYGERSLSQIVMMVVNASAPAKQDVQLITSKQATVQKANHPLPSLCVLV